VLQYEREIRQLQAYVERLESQLASARVNHMDHRSQADWANALDRSQRLVHAQEVRFFISTFNSLQRNSLSFEPFLTHRNFCLQARLEAVEAANERLVAALNLLKERYSMHAKNEVISNNNNNNNNGAVTNGAMRAPAASLLAELAELRSSSC
jgi:hypothetical protein